MTEGIECDNISLLNILPKNKNYLKSGNRRWSHAAYCKKIIEKKFSQQKKVIGNIEKFA